MYCHRSFNIRLKGLFKMKKYRKIGFTFYQPYHITLGLALRPR